MNAFTPVPDTENAVPIGHDAQPAASMMQAIEQLVAAQNRSTAELLSELRRQFPDSPLSLRIRALEALRRR